MLKIFLQFGHSCPLPNIGTILFNKSNCELCPHSASNSGKIKLLVNKKSFKLCCNSSQKPINTSRESVQSWKANTQQKVGIQLMLVLKT